MSGIGPNLSKHPFSAGPMALILSLVACGGDDPAGSGGMGGAGGSGGLEPVDVVLTGAVQKGPFIIGSNLDVVLADSAGEPTGEVFPTTITNDLGEFEVSFTHAGPLTLVGDGFHYNEVTGAISTAPISLRALHTITTAGTQQAYVNLVTHLSERRARSLLDGSDVATAVAQAEQELVSALGVGPTALDPGTGGIEMNLLGGSDLANAYLFAVSAVMAQAAATAAGADGSPDGELQELINAIAIDFEDAALDPPRAQLLLDAETELLPERAYDLLAARLAALGSSAAPPDLNLVVDTDHDDIVNADDSCPWFPNPMQSPVPTEICFASASPLPESPMGDVARVDLVDLDGDTNLDIVARVGQSSYTFLAGDGAGSFTVAQTVEIPSPVETAHFADVNDDGVVDVVAQSGSDELSVYLRTASFDPLPMPVITTVSGPGGLARVHNTMDADAFPDLLTVASFGTNGTVVFDLPMTLLINDGNGGFNESTAGGAIPMGTSFQGPLAVGMIDVTGDTNNDVVLAGVSSAGDQAVILTLPGDGQGGLDAVAVSTAVLPMGGDPMQLGDFHIADLTDDGDVDIVVVGRGPDVVLLPGNGDGSFGPEVISDAGMPLDFSSVAAIGQLTGDTLPDLVITRSIAQGGDLGIVVIPNLGGGNFGSAVTRVARLLGPTDQPAQGAAAANLDGRGYDDIVLTNGPLSSMRFGP